MICCAVAVQTKGFGCLLFLSKIFLNGDDEFFYTGEVAPPQALLSEFAEPTLDQIKPGRAGGSVMDMKPRMLGQPIRDLVMLMWAVIVYHQVQLQSTGCGSIKLAQELQIFLMSMTGHTLTDNRAVQDVEGRKESRRPVPLIVVSHRAATTLLKRETRLRSLQGLNLTFLIHAQHQRFMRRIQIQAHHIVEFFDKLFIFRQLEGAAAMRLQSIRVPNTLDRRGANAMSFGHGPHAPMSRRFGSRMQRSLHDFLYEFNRLVQPRTS